MDLIKNMSISAILLGLFAIVGTALVSLTYINTADRIAENHRNMLLRSLHELITPDQHDNDLFADTVEVVEPALLGTKRPVTIYRARMNKQPVAAIINSIAPDGYSGDIHLLVAVYTTGKLAGVRVVKHKETPGLGDAIETSRGDWILGFANHSLTSPEQSGWAVKRDGGIFDQFTGATVTPRAIVKAVYNSLLYFKANQKTIFKSVEHSSDKDTDTHEHN
ncbi:MAG: electron transport complex subunit RsxG [Gammaproteobacteria bacterium]|nr:electron transport complex subunit RsxG [Gammaproteobacteria bacterium]